MSVLHVLTPQLTESDASRNFAHWLARGDRLPLVPDPRQTLLREAFRFAGDPIPVAALRHHCHAGDAGMGMWLCADPAYVRSEAMGARLMACPLDDLSRDEAEDLAATLKPLLGDAGVPLAVDTPSAWCAHLPDGAPPAVFVAPRKALGADLLECLPEGDAGRPWRRLFNEAQIALHAHPVNAARIDAGKLPVNALWFWGAGALPGAVDSALQWVASDDDVVRGLAKLAKVNCIALTPQAFGTAEPGGDALLDLDAPTHADFVDAWLPHFQDWLRTRHFAAIEFNFPDGETFRIRHVHRLRFWRRG